jgi:hypothetical protein
MVTNSRRASLALVVGVLSILVGGSERALAQQTGLFPLAPIRRQRVPCDQEDAIYKINKQKFFGYHPTAWRRFPEGWSLPSPDAPNREQSFKEIKLGSTPESFEGEAGPGEEMRPQPAPAGPGARPPAATLPADRSPFETDVPGAAPGAAPAPRGGQAPKPGTPPPGARSPFDDIPDPGAAPPVKPRAPQSAVTPPAPGAGAPELTAPEAQPRANVGMRSRRGEPDQEATEEESGPLLALPSIDLSRPAPLGTGPDAQPGASTALAEDPASNPNATAPPPPQAPPQRRGLLSNLFGGLGLNWLRR